MEKVAHSILTDEHNQKKNRNTNTGSESQEAGMAIKQEAPHEREEKVMH
jgi:hypothetical protein